jgi:hypothetical protein
MHVQMHREEIQSTSLTMQQQIKQNLAELVSWLIGAYKPIMKYA